MRIRFAEARFEVKKIESVNSLNRWRTHCFGWIVLELLLLHGESVDAVLANRYLNVLTEGRRVETETEQRSVRAATLWKGNRGECDLLLLWFRQHCCDLVKLYGAVDDDDGCRIIVGMLSCCDVWLKLVLCLLFVNENVLLSVETVRFSDGWRLVWWWWTDEIERFCEKIWRKSEGLCLVNLQVIEGRKLGFDLSRLTLHFPPLFSEWASVFIGVIEREFKW